MHVTAISVRSTGEPLGFLLGAHLAMHGTAKTKAAITCNDHERFQTAAGEKHDHHVCHPKGETNLKISKSKEFDEVTHMSN